MTVPVGGSPLLSDEQVRRAQSRTRAVLIAGQVLAGIGMGSTLSAGALLVTQVSGSPAWSGMAATMTTVGAAFASVPLARLARRAGRAPALATGAVTAALGADALWLDTDDADVLAATLTAEGVPAQAIDGRVLVRTPDARERVAALYARSDVRGVSIQPPTLDDVFAARVGARPEAR